MSRLSLETGTWDYFRPAQTLYRRHGFAECSPFGDYVLDPSSVFMSLDLREEVSWSPEVKGKRKGLPAS
jgi:putative acetyltransferase